MKRNEVDHIYAMTTVSSWEVVFSDLSLINRDLRRPKVITFIRTIYSVRTLGVLDVDE